MQVQIIGNKKIEFTPQGISYILDILSGCPWKMANPLINDILGQLKQQEGKEDGSAALGNITDIASRRDPRGSSGGLSSVETEPANDGTEVVS